MTSSPPKLFLLDAMALIYRAHFAFSKNPRVTSSGLNSSAVFGFTNTLLEILHKEKPTHIGVAFDTAGPTFRHTAFEAYKANRQEQPEDIAIAIPYTMKMLEAMRIPILILPGFEADDIIGTIATKAGAQGFQVYMMTMDKDYCQLVSENIFLYRPAYMGSGHDVLDVAKVLEKFQIKEVCQVIDILGLQGDAVDNIPGIPGIGEKTAQKLIAEYGSVENLIANADQLKGKQRENVIQFAEQGLLSKHLATIDINVPVDFDPESLLLEAPDRDKVNALCEELEFRNIKKRILGEEPESNVNKASSNIPVKPTANTNQMSLFGATDEMISEETTPVAEPKNYSNIHTTPHSYHIIRTDEEIEGLVKYLLQLKEFCFDTETTKLDAITAEIVGLSFAYFPHEGYYVPVPANQEDALVLMGKFKKVFENEHILKIGQNIKFDLLVLKNYGIELKGKMFDTMLAHYLLEPDMRHNMDAMAESYLQYTPVSIEALIGKKGVKQGTMRDVEIEDIAEYAAEDADITFQLKQIFAPRIQHLKLDALLDNVESPLIDVLAAMEHEGVKIDPISLKDYSLQLGEEIVLIEKKIYEQAGVNFNIASPKQLGEVLFEKLKLDPKAKKTKTGQYATGEEVLSKLAFEHKIAKDITDFRELQKLKSTYIDALPLLISPVDGRIHTNYNQAVAATGRLSSTNPNLQNIPIRTERGREIRKAFVRKDENHLIFSADYSQIELRIMAAFSKEKNMMESFQKGIDIHSTTASKVFKVGLEEVTSDMRRKAKMVNFGIIYGISAFGLAQRLDIARREAADIIEAYFTEFPAIKTYMDETVNNAREMEYVETILGRRRYLRDINSRNITLRGYAERNAINAPIQGSAADMIKVAMINIHAWMKQEKLASKMVMQVHDELVFDAHISELEILKENVSRLMRDAIVMEVPMEVGMGAGENWLEAH